MTVDPSGLSNFSWEVTGEPSSLSNLSLEVTVHPSGLSNFSWEVTGEPSGLSNFSWEVTGEPSARSVKSCSGSLDLSAVRNFRFSAAAPHVRVGFPMPRDGRAVAAIGWVEEKRGHFVDWKQPSARADRQALCDGFSVNKNKGEGHGSNG